MFSSVFYFAAVALYEGVLMVGYVKTPHYVHIQFSINVLSSPSSYATVYTMAPVFSLVLDEDVSADIALMYPELYRDLMKVSLLF